MLNSLFSKIQFSTHKRPSQDKQRENFSKKFIKKFSRSADTLKQSQDDLNSKSMPIFAKEKSFSLTDAHFLNSIDDPLSSPINQNNNNNTHSRFQTNFYRRFKGAKRQENVTHHSGEDLDTKSKQNKIDVINRIVKHATFIKHDNQNNKNESKIEAKNSSDRQDKPEESDEDYDDDSIFVDDDNTSESEREENNILINKTSTSNDGDEEELERQIFREIYLLDKTLEEYS